ncbi:uncharacterized membrane protein YciS (DUF1049 family) [Arthrobacter sp. B2I5]|uniref:hypothetical protein n=1 Tax=Arthrobacter sp. B2I5 TaxID=3042266 RepID=UPI0027897AD7|nr:hypothetical protein [Arthrobacter sp. B2I5]MDQ0825395.1 uncharacterized membrane protein YciS (DUF1049 family) [Arthrobacter sp. B2I5]
MINLLDGLRDLKAPLASGLIILFGFWLIFANEVAAAGPGQSLAGNIHQLIDYLGAPATLGLVAFLGYLIGLVLSLNAVTMFLILVVQEVREMAPPSREPIRFLLEIKRNINVQVSTNTTSEDTTRRLNEHIENALQEAAENRGWTPRDILQVVKPYLLEEYDQKSPGNPPLQKGFPIWQTPLFGSVHQYLYVSIVTEIDLLAVQLHAEKDKIYEKYDKNKTESDFRAAVILPILFVALVTMIRFFDEGLAIPAILTMLAIVLIAIRLGASAHQRLIEANEAVLNALLARQIKAPRLQIFEENRSTHFNGEATVTP